MLNASTTGTSSTNTSQPDSYYLTLSKWLHVVAAGATALSAYLASQAFAQTSVPLLQATVVSGGIAVVANAAGVAIAS
jgi:hypothetical protein